MSRDSGDQGHPSDDSGPDPSARDRRGRASHWRTADDDLLKGLDRPGRRPELRAFFASTIAASLLVWEIAFDLGAYHTVFYSRLFQLVVISTVLLIGSIALRHRVRVRLWMRAALCVPLLLLLSRLIVPPGSGGHGADVLDGVLIGLTVLSVPFTLIASARVMVPEYFEMNGRRLKWVSVSIVALIAVSGLLVGQFNYRFTTCQEYNVAGDDLPNNCRQVPSPSRSGSPSPSGSPSQAPSPSPLASPSPTS